MISSLLPPGKLPERVNGGILAIKKQQTAKTPRKKSIGPVSKDGLGRSVVSGFGREWNILQTVDPLFSILGGFGLGTQTNVSVVP